MFYYYLCNKKSAVFAKVFVIVKIMSSQGFSLREYWVASAVFTKA